MRKELLSFLAGHWSIEVFHSEGEEILDGILIDSESNNEVFVIKGIPRFVPLDFLKFDSDFKDFLSQYASNLKPFQQTPLKWKHFDVKKNDDEKIIGKKNAQSFGFEWDYFSEWGWIDESTLSKDEIKYKFRGGGISNTERAFKTKCMLTDQDLREDHLILDAGCGNGRYTNQASKMGATVIGVDLGYGVRTAYKHLKNKKNVHIVQANLFNLPFKENLFDVIFSNGVLMHTGNAKKAFHSISKHGKTGSIFVAHLYHMRNIIFELIDGSLRFFTTKLSIQSNLKLAKKLAGIGQKLMEKGTWAKWFKFVEILPTEHHMFDWYSAPIATHHTYPEVKQWFSEAGFEILDTNEKNFPNITFWNKPESLTIKGRKDHRAPR